jgi:hypothetical protein
MPLDLRAGGALVLLFGMLVSRITQVTKGDVIEDGQATWLANDGHRAAWERQCRGSSPAALPWPRSFPPRC